MLHTRRQCLSQPADRLQLAVGCTGTKRDDHVASTAGGLEAMLVLQNIAAQTSWREVFFRRE